MEGQTQLLKGINYGTYSFTKDHLVAMKDNKTVLQIPLNKIGNCSVVNKQDVALELQTDEIGFEEDVLCEMRFYLPSKTDNKEETSDKGKEDQAEKGSEDEQEGKAEESNVKGAADILSEQILAKANLTQKAGDVIVSFPDLPFIVPRGKYSCDLSINSLRMHGPTFNHIILYKNISKAFLLPKPDDVHMLFVLSLDKPVRQGNTSYHYLVMQIKKDVRETIKMKLPPEQLEQQLNEKLKEEYEGNLHDVVAKVFKSIIKINIIIPGDFESSTKHSGVKCSVKASEGHLFFLTKSLIFVPKPVIYVRLDELKGVEFHRLGSIAQIKLFDITLNLKNGQQHSFSGIDKKELEIVKEYFNARNVVVKTVEEFKNYPGEISDDDEEEEEEPEDSRKRRKVPQREMIDEDDEEDEEDEDFIAQDDDDDDDDIDFDEEDLEDEKPKKPVKKPAKK
jgi:structure-specific recognition protein 1